MSVMADDLVADVRGTLYSAREVLELVPSITYRMLDRWCRLGYARCAFPPDGSGTPRMFTAADLEGIRAVAAASEAAEAIMRTIRSGEVFVTAWAAAIRRQVNS